MRNIPIKILYIITPIIFLILFTIDLFHFYSGLIITSLANIKEFLVFALIISWIVIHKKHSRLPTLSLSQKLWHLTIFMGISYLAVFIFNLFTDPQYSRSFPHTYQSFSAIVEANIIAVLAFSTLIPIMMITRDLIFSKQKRTTRLYFNLFLLFMGLTAISVFLTKQPLFKFSAETVYNDIFASFTIILIILLAFRNDWITYLPRREKIIYFSLGIFVYSGIIALPDYVYKPTASAYSLVLASATNIISLFLLIYAGFAMLKLFFHLPTAKAFDRKLKEVNSLYDLSRTLNSEPNFQKQTQLITQLTARVLGSSSTWFQLYNREENRLEITSHINLSQSQILDNPLAALNGINQIMIQKKGAVLINDIQQHKQFRDLSKWKGDTRAFIAAPLFSNRNQLMGIIYATKPQPYGFDIEDISLLEGFADQAAIALENANLFEASIKKERLEQELKIAREVQLKLLPQEVPATEGFELDSYSITAYEVGGDYYDFFEFGDGYFGVIIGDVSGKGTSAAFYMAEFKGVVQTLAKTFSDPLELICQANLIFFSHIERRVFVSAIVGKYIPEKSDFQFVRAGHNPLLYASNHHSPPVYVQPPGLAIGLDRGEIFDRTIQLHHLKLEVGDNIILFTDGLTEARNAEGDEYGEERLIRVMENAQAYSAVEIKEIILEDVLNFVGNSPLHDDLTFIVMKRK